MRHIVHITGLWHHRLKTVKLFLEPICVRFRVAKSPFLGAQFTATSRDISLPKLLEWEGNGLTQSSRGFVPVEKSVSHPPVRSVRFVQVEPCVRVTKQIESAMGKDGLSPLQLLFRSDRHERSRY